MSSVPHLRSPDPLDSGAAPAALDLDAEARRSFQFIWRVVRRLGVRPDSAVDDAVQRVFEIAAKKRALIEPGKERAFLFRTATLIALEHRRAAARDARSESIDALELADSRPGPDEILDRRRARELLDALLLEMSDAQRTVFVLFELEGLSSLEISELLGVPAGTVASRLRLARDSFRQRVAALQRKNR